MMKGKKIVVIGGGKMGEVIMSGILSAGLGQPGSVTVTDIVHDRLAYLKGKYAVAATEDNRKAAREADIIVLAVKPQGMGDVLKELAPVIDRKKLVISIAAGIPIRFIAEHLKKGVPIVRVMPNTPALVGEGAAALAAGENASGTDLAAAREIFDVVTGLSGSGPAYAFIMIDALSDGGVLMGLPRDVAQKLAAQTLLGAAKLFLEGGKHPGELRDMVTSPGGTTIAGIHALEKYGLRSSLIHAVEAATLRSKELGKGK
jgi:pyrroline-5-carboxylate reductase